jgi:hypothetical protein
MNDQHDNEQTDKEMLARTVKRDYGVIRRGMGELLDWIDGLGPDEVTEVLRWFAFHRPTVLREAKRYLDSQRGLRPPQPGDGYERILEDAPEPCPLTRRFPHHKPGVLMGCTCLSEGTRKLTEQVMVRAELERPKMSDLPERCLVCGKIHKPPEVVGPNGVKFWPGHEYIIRTRIGTQKLPREWRMGYLGFSNGMEFSARGPDRTHGGQYGGTQVIGLEVIIYAKEVERDDAKRYVSRTIR